MTLVSVIIPCYNEQSRIGNLLNALKDQTYPQEQIEILIADGLSTDNTRGEIAGFKWSHPSMKIEVVDNPTHSIPAGLNLALRASHGEVMVRLDAHSRPYPDYIEKCVEAINQGLAENVGGIWEIQPGSDTWLAQSIARAAAMPIAVGDALYRHASKPAYVETVPFGAFKREMLAHIGFYNETLLTNEDYEFNARILASGGRIWLDPRIRSQYFARASISDLARQYARYGFWKWKMLQGNPASLRWRQLLPPLFILSLLVLLVIALIYRSLWFIPIALLGIYLLVLMAFSLGAAVQTKKLFYLVGIPMAIATMHVSWGLGFLWSMINRTRFRSMGLRH